MLSIELHLVSNETVYIRFHHDNIHLLSFLIYFFHITSFANVSPHLVRMKLPLRMAELVFEHEETNKRGETSQKKMWYHK
jgi:hypothetical protein